MHAGNTGSRDEVPADEVSFVDDTAQPISAREPTALLSKLAAAAAICKSTFAAHSMRLNFALFVAGIC